jgi:hypothetical protein
MQAYPRIMPHTHDLTLQNPVVTLCTTKFSTKNSTFCPQIVCLWFVYFSEKQFFPFTALTDRFLYGNTLCLLCSTNQWIFKYNSCFFSPLLDLLDWTHKLKSVTNYGLCTWYTMNTFKITCTYPCTFTQDTTLWSQYLMQKKCF